MNIVERLNKIAEEVNNYNIKETDIIDLLYLEDFIYDLFPHIRKLKFYSLNGYLESVLSKVIFNKAKEGIEFNSIKEFLDLLNDEFKKLIVPNVILLPINVRSNSVKTDDILFDNNNLRIFIKDIIKNIDKYMQRNAYIELLADHIVCTKDRNFFNFPIMTILIDGIDFSIYEKAPELTESIYSIFRMFSIIKSRSIVDGEVLNLNERSTSYGIYHSSPKMVSEKKISSGNGYPFRKSYSNILDMDLKIIDENKEEISKIITNVIENTFIDETLVDNISFIERSKWTNSFLLFNEAYELASIEKFETANLILLTILESFYTSKGDKNKSRKIQERIKDIDLFGSDIENYINIIDHLYKKRNDFVHEGLRFKKRMMYRTLHEGTGLCLGFKPLTFIDEYYEKYNKDLYYLKGLFVIVIRIILSKVDDYI